MMIDPLADLKISAKSYDVQRIASVYFDKEGRRCWAKAWFNGSERGEPAVELTERRKLAVMFINGQVSKDSFLSQLYPKQMVSYLNSLNITRQQLLGVQK